MTIKIYGHPWSINTRKTLMTLAERGQEAELVVIALPKGEQKTPQHLARHPWGKVPVLDDDGFVLYESRAINTYIDRKVHPPSLVPEDPRLAARVDQWISAADAYFSPHAQPLIVELLFRRYLGGEKDANAIVAGRAGIQSSLDVVDHWLASNAYLAGSSFSLADIHWMPSLEYLSRIGEGAAITSRRNLEQWWSRVSERPAWRKVARTGPQPYEA
jgi:glutathione S-transferase